MSEYNLPLIKETTMGWYEILQHLDEAKMQYKKKRDTCLDRSVSEECQDIIEAIDNAMSCVMKNIPRKPEGVYLFGNTIRGVCPNVYCKHTGITKDIDQRCSICGQAIDWEYDIPLSTEEEKRKALLEKM